MLNIASTKHKSNTTSNRPGKERSIAVITRRTPGNLDTLRSGLKDAL